MVITIYSAYIHVHCMYIYAFATCSSITNDAMMHPAFFPGAPAEANHDQSPDTGSEQQVASTPPPVPVERSESVFSSASKHYLSLSRLNSIFPVSRSSSNSLSVSTPVLPIAKKNRVDLIHDSISKMERVWSCVL